MDFDDNAFITFLVIVGLIIWGICFGSIPMVFDWCCGCLFSILLFCGGIFIGLVITACIQFHLEEGIYIAVVCISTLAGMLLGGIIGFSAIKEDGKD